MNGKTLTILFLKNMKKANTKSVRLLELVCIGFPKTSYFPVLSTRTSTNDVRTNCIWCCVVFMKSVITQRESILLFKTLLLYCYKYMLHIYKCFIARASEACCNKHRLWTKLCDGITFHLAEAVVCWSTCQIQWWSIGRIQPFSPFFTKRQIRI